MLKRAGDKMALERIVIKKGAFQDLGSTSSKDAEEVRLCRLLGHAPENALNIHFLKDVNNAGLGGSQRQNTRLIRYFSYKTSNDLAKTEAGPGGAGEAQLPPPNCPPTDHYGRTS